MSLATGGCGEDTSADDVADAAHPEQHGPGDAGLAPCQVPAGCGAVDTLALSLQPCCTATIACGYALTRPEELRELVYGPSVRQLPDTPEGRCVALEKIFLSAPSKPEKRVETPGGEPIFYTPECQSRAILAYPFVGCCMPSGECGLSTDVALRALQILALPAASPLARAECTSAQKLNEAFLASSPFAGFAHFEPTGGRCDYAGLAARLSRADVAP